MARDIIGKLSLDQSTGHQDEEQNARDATGIAYAGTSLLRLGEFAMFCVEVLVLAGADTVSHSQYYVRFGADDLSPRL